MPDHDRRPFLALPTGKPAKFGPEKGPFRMARGVGTCHEDGPEPLVAFAGPTAFALARTSIVPWIL